MYNIILWSWWKHRLHFIFLVATFYSVSISSNLVIAQNNSVTTATTTTSTVSPVNSSNNSGSEEYYYYSEEEPAVNQTKFSNRTVIGDEYYYYLEEVVLRPKNTTGLSNWNVIVSDNFTLRPQGKTILTDSAKSESVPHLVGDVSFGNGIVFPSPEPIGDDGPIVSSVIHPDNNPTEDFDFEYNLQGIGDGPPPPSHTSPHGEVDPSVNNLVSVLHSGEHDGAPPDFLRAPLIPPVEPQEDDVEIKPFVPMPLDIDGENIVPFKLADHNKPSHPFGTVSLHNNHLPGFGFDSMTWAEKNPIMAITEFLTQAYTYLSQMSKADVVVWIEKFINVIAELEIPYPDEHYMSVVSFAGIYLFVALFLYGADNLSDFQCAAEGNGFPSKHWNYHASRRYVPAKSVDPHLQRKLLDLFTGDDDDDDDYLDRSSLGRSSEEDFLEELDHVSELCPKDTFFYSLNPRHIEAYSAIQRLLVAPETTERFISLARHLLHSDKVHPKVWYIGVVGASLQRSDMTGFIFPHPLDAIPDWFIPADLISDLMQEYRKIRIKRSTSLLYPTNGKPYRIVKKRPGKNNTRDGSTTFSVFSITPTLGPPSARFQLNTTAAPNQITNSTSRTKITTPSRSPTKSPSFSTSTTAKMAAKTHPSKKKDIVYKKHIKSPPTVKLKKGNFTVTIVSSKDINVTYSNGTIKEMSKVPFPFFSNNIMTKHKNGISLVHKNKNKNKMEAAKTKTGAIKIDDSKNKNETTTKKSKDPPKVTTSKISGTKNKNATTTKTSKEPPKVTMISGAKNKTVSSGNIKSDTSKKRVESLSTKKKLGSLKNKTLSIGSNKIEIVPKKSLGTLLDQMNKLATGVVAIDALDTSASSSGSGSTEEVKGETGIALKNPLKQNSKNTGNNKQQDDDESLGEQSTKSHNRRKKKRKKKEKCIKVDWKSGLDNGIENELWYWREDLMINQHHWYWHQTHPVNSTQHGDRRAELFYFMHRSLVARYNAERLSNRLPITKPLRFGPHGIMHEGYNSHLADVNSGIFWTPRWPGTPLSSIIHEHDPDFALNISMRGYMRSFGRLVKAVKTGRMYTKNGMLLPIDHFKGIEPLANTVEASDHNVNPLLYDQMGIHAMGHIMIALAADPDYRFQKVTGVMSESAVSMRDPIFYPYHTFIDNFFESYKRRLAPYEPIGGDFPLLWKGVELVEIELHSQGGGPVNELRTFWARHKFQLSPGVDRSIKKGEKHAKICAQHLDHEPFYFKIVIDRKPCVRSKSGKAMVRIFMAPRYDEKGRRIPVKLQRRLMFPLDAFPVKLRVGKNTITRYAEDSSLTQPWTKSIEDFERGPDPSGSADFCGCGFPQHLYIPKGHVAGMAFDLFVMVTDYDIDFVPNDPRDLEVPETCNSPYIFCGLQKRRYPDRRPMGYPFDRPLFRSLDCPPGWTFFSVLCKTVNMILNNPLDTLEQYVSKVPNMAMLKFHIKHLDALFPEPARHRR